MKRIISAATCALALCGVLTGCSPVTLIMMNQMAVTVTEQTVCETNLLVKSEVLGFQVEVPQLFDERFQAKADAREVYGETVDRVTVVYESGEAQANVCTVELMSSSLWDKMQAEGGPVGTEIARSEDGRVAVMTSLQSNPFVEGTADYDLFQQIPDALAVISDSFAFLNG